MVRASYAKVLIRLGGTLPSPWTEAAVTALCVAADRIIDGYTSPASISATSDIAIELGVDVTLRLMRQADMLRQSSGASSVDGRTYAEIDILTEDIKQRIDSALDTSYSGITTINLMEE